MRGCRGERTASTTAPAPLLLLPVGSELSLTALLYRSRNQTWQWQHELALEALERFGTRALAGEMRDAFGELEIDVAHARDERDRPPTTSSTNFIAATIFSSHARSSLQVRHVRRSRRLLHPKR